MINFSKVGTKEELLKAISELPEETTSATKELVAQGKAAATLLVNTVSTNGAHCNLRVNKINQFVQIECQVAGHEIIKPKAPAPAET